MWVTSIEWFDYKLLNLGTKRPRRGTPDLEQLLSKLGVLMDELKGNSREGSPNTLGISRTAPYFPPRS